MHLRQVKRYMHLLIVPETDKLKLYFFIVQESKFVFPHFYPLANAGIFIQIVIFTKIALVQYLVNHLAAFTAKYFFFSLNFFIRASLTAMETLYFLFCQAC